MSRWFRYYDEALDDPKVQALDGEAFKAWVNVLCLASRNNGFLPSIEAVAFGLRITVDGARTVVERLLNATLIDRVSGGPDGYRYAPHGWGERQYKSDTSTDRVKRFRERSKTDAETPPEQNRVNNPPTPRKRRDEGKQLLPADWEVPAIGELPPKARALAEQWPSEAYATEGEAFVCYWRSERKMKADWRGTWANRVIDRHLRVMQQAKFDLNKSPSEPANFLDHYQREMERKKRAITAA